MSFSFAYGSFGDILETARLAKKIFDAMYNPSGSPSIERQKTITILKSLYEDVAILLRFTDMDSSSPDGHMLADRILAELASCRSLMEALCAKINQPSSFLAKIWTALTEERELASWTSEMMERRAVLHTLLELLNIVVSQRSGLHVQDVASHMKYVRGEVKDLTVQVQNIESEVQTVAGQVKNIGVATMFTSCALGESITNVRAQVKDVGVELRTQLQQIIQNTTSVQHMLEPMFFVIDPVGGVIQISATYCQGFRDLHRIINAHLTNRTLAGRRYVERGDYNLVTTEGCVILPRDFDAKAKPGMRLDISIIKHKVSPTKAAGSSCPQCGSLVVDVLTAWLDCPNPLCGCRFQLSEPKIGPHDINPHRLQSAREIIPRKAILNDSEPEGSETFRLLQIRVVSTVGDLSPALSTLISPWQLVCMAVNSFHS
ncbi:hypothetical protein B0H17DRAFT_1112340 [Mycena rosella]|uniref:Ubiquitin-like domain-containing protein n=1 Tax=Mycena rosella TaxID=1033263 RepID=A0AAD7BJG3_MYCRO|nr:hypothetical protein B0H17DRAFT_1112340 [Mycena rosella]